MSLESFGFPSHRWWGFLAAKTVMNQHQKMIVELHRKIDCPVRDKPTLIDVKDRMRRARLIISEAAEYLEAADQHDMVEMADALADILVVVYGTAVEMGIDLEPVFAEVHRSNMSKDGGFDAGGKYLKGPGFVAPNIENELQRQGWVK